MYVCMYMYVRRKKGRGIPNSTEFCGARKTGGRKFHDKSHPAA